MKLAAGLALPARVAIPILEAMGIQQRRPPAAARAPGRSSLLGR